MLKNLLRRCSRNLVWKADVAVEVEALAEDLCEQQMEESQFLQDRILACRTRRRHLVAELTKANAPLKKRSRRPARTEDPGTGAGVPAAGAGAGAGAGPATDNPTDDGDGYSGDTEAEGRRVAVLKTRYAREVAGYIEELDAEVAGYMKRARALQRRSEGKGHAGGMATAHVGAGAGAGAAAGAGVGASGAGAGSEKGESLLDVLAGLVLGRTRRQKSMSGVEHEAWVASTKAELRRQWLSEFEQLPVRGVKKAVAQEAANLAAESRKRVVQTSGGKRPVGGGIVM